MQNQIRPKSLNQIACMLVLILAAAAVPSAHSAEATSPSELLEKGIYTQETKGDLDAAIALYQQVVNEAKDATALAAQAQYRLAVCYYKKKDFAKASATFEKLVKDYPEQKDVVALANEYLAGAANLLPAPWEDPEQLQLDVKFASGFKLGQAVYSVASSETNGQKIWQLSSHMFAGVQQLSRVEVVADSFKPLHSLWKHTLIGEADAVYSRGSAEVRLKGKEPKKVEFEGVMYDNEEAIQMFRRLPLTTNYSTTVRVLTTLGGGTIVPVKLEVVGIEKVEVPLGSFECYKCELSIKQTFWYSTDPHHYLVKFEAGGAIVELTQINHRNMSEPLVWKDPSSKFQITLPAGWSADRHEPDEAGEGTRIYLMDPNAVATSMLSVQKLGDLKSEVRKSVRAWADSQIADGAKVLKDVKVRPDTWKERTVAGQPGVSVLADFVEGKEKKTGYLVCVFVDQKAVQFLAYAGGEDLETVRPQIEAIIDSLKTEVK